MPCDLPLMRISLLLGNHTLFDLWPLHFEQRT